MKVYLATLGCKLNESELQAWSHQFAQTGHELTDDPAEADLCVLNTCTVTHVAARKSRQLARQLARQNPHARLVLTGCYVSTSPDQAKELPNVALLVPNADKDRLVALAGALVGETRYQTTETGCRLPEAASGELLSSAAAFPGLGSAAAMQHARTRSFVKIMDGCNMGCTYCIIPLARGRERSRPLPEIVAQVAGLVQAGYKEIILTGVQISVYDNGGDKVHGLRDLVSAILADTDVPRLRLTSIAPWDFDESLLDLWSDPRLCRHIHLSLQSGSDTVLRRMRRPYDSARFARAANLARERIPDVGITTDVIVGFPGESDAEFETSLHFVESLEFSRIHVFPYSSREGTLAATLPLPVADQVKEARVKQMQAIADASARAFASRFLGREMPVLWETAGPPEEAGSPPVWSGYTDNYIHVQVKSEAPLHNQISAARLQTIVADGIKGELV
jgi:threonylcarbamoyladenosine tRNA methylthiotransferase MtaB